MAEPTYEASREGSLQIVTTELFVLQTARAAVTGRAAPPDV
jgi:hypothetical protein